MNLRRCVLLCMMCPDSETRQVELGDAWPLCLFLALDTAALTSTWSWAADFVRDTRRQHPKGSLCVLRQGCQDRLSPRSDIASHRESGSYIFVAIGFSAQGIHRRIAESLFVRILRLSQIFSFSIMVALSDFCTVMHHSDKLACLMSKTSPSFV